MPLNVALVCTDATVRARAAEALDGAPADWSIGFYGSPPPSADVIVVGPGGGGPGVCFDPEHPERLLPAIEDALGPRPAVVAVTSATRGLGVTTLALHLAAAAARRGPDAALVDLDRAWQGARNRTGIAASCKTWGSVTGDRDVELAATPVPGGFRLLAAPSLGEPAPEPAVSIRAGARRFGRVVLDLPSDGPLAAVLPLCSTAIVVVAPTQEGAERAGTFASALGEVPAVFVLNRLGAGSDVTLRSLERPLGRPIAYELPCTPSLRDAEDQHRLLDRTSNRWLRRVRELASKVLP
jgi:hypothetical protein